MNARPTRAKPLSADERRTAILEAVIPLLVENGAAVTTAEMAEAAGIAEGTIFRVFPDKAALLHAAIGKTMNPVPFQEALAQIAVDAPIEDQLVIAADALAQQFERVTALFGMLRSIPHNDTPHAESHRIAHESMETVAASLADLLERHREHLRVEPARAATLLRGLVFANSHQMLAPDDKMTSEQLIEVLTVGIVTRNGV